MFCPCQLTVLKSSCSSPETKFKVIQKRRELQHTRLTSSLHSVDEHAPEPHLADDLVKRATANPVLLETVA